MQAYQTILVLEDHTVYYGWSFNKSFTSLGEVIFNTGMTGYQEIMTDPSYNGQIINFTYPELGNTGINIEDNEAAKPYLKGIIARNLCTEFSNWRASTSLVNYLKNKKIPHIYGIDTRALTRHLRKVGTMNGCISSAILKKDLLIEKLNLSPNIEGQDLVDMVSTKKPYTINEKHFQSYLPLYYQISKYQIQKQENLNIIVLDFGTKYNIFRNLFTYVSNVIVVSPQSSLQEILSYNPNGILLSNGPGDPKAITYGINTVKQLLKYKIPIFGICMGYQILSLALGLDTFKLKFGHRGLNHPIGYNNNIEMSSQNHGFATSKNHKILNDIIMNQFNKNDQTIAGITHREYPYFAVQYHPEASPGPHDSNNLFLHFIRIIKLIEKYPELLTI